MKTIPKKVDVLGHSVSVSRAKLDDCHGQFVIDDKSGKAKIQLCKELDPDYSEKILFHELVHAALHFSGVVETLTDIQEEAVVRAMEHGIFPLYERK